MIILFLLGIGLLISLGLNVYLLWQRRWPRDPNWYELEHFAVVPQTNARDGRSTTGQKVVCEHIFYKGDRVHTHEKLRDDEKQVAGESRKDIFFLTMLRLREAYRKIDRYLEFCTDPEKWDLVQPGYAEVTLSEDDEAILVNHWQYAEMSDYYGVTFSLDRYKNSNMVHVVLELND